MGNGDCKGSCGQIEMGFNHRDPRENDKRYESPIRAEGMSFAPGWDIDTWYEFLHIWHVWHLNGKRPGCKHMSGPAWDTGKELTLTPLGWGKKYFEMRRAAETSGGR